ncbi:MAG: pitrilysin family protein [Planctomycetota bacterium]
MKLEPIASPMLSEDVWRAKLPSGLELTVGRKADHARSFGILSTEYGSIDGDFRVNGTEHRVPDGVAHFLEHKLFEKEDGDVSDRFHQLGADTNAATSYTTTSYLFSCSDRFEPCLDLLIDFVLVPHFTEEGVAKEQGIIAQEINMYQDHPDYRLFTNLLGALYAEHPVRVDIAGTLESIAKIDAETLYTCHRTFYHPSNMALVVVGPKDPEAVLEQVAARLEYLAIPDATPVERVLPNEPLAVARHEIAELRTVSRPRVAIGFKAAAQEPPTGAESLRSNVAFAIAMELAFGRSSPAHHDLYERGIIDESFSFSQASERGFAFAALGGETEEPETFQKELLSVIEGCQTKGLDSGGFARARNRYLGAYVRSFDSVEACAHTYLNAFHRKVSPFSVYEIVDSLELGEVEQALRDRIDLSDYAVSEILPAAS